MLQPLLAGIALLLWLTLSDVDGAELQPRGSAAEGGDGGQAFVDGLAILTAGGTPAQIGKRIGTLQGAKIRSLLRIMAVRSLPARVFHPRRVAAQVAALAPDHRDELRAIAASSGVGGAALAATNILVDSQCSALVSPAAPDRPLRVARNLDFFPAGILGRRTVLTIVRPDGKHAFAAVGWPGCAGVLSGMNDAGLTACILLNHSQRRHAPAQPVCFRAREILERCASVEDGIACFAAAPVASGHYLVLADARTAVVLWQDADGVHLDHPTNGWLACVNGPRDRCGLPSDRRGRQLRRLAAAMDPETVSDADMRQALSATYLNLLNAQAMVFEPATRTLELAIGGALHPAALAAWRRIDLRALLAGAPATAAAVADLGRSIPLPHPLMFR